MIFKQIDFSHHLNKIIHIDEQTFIFVIRNITLSNL